MERRRREGRVHDGLIDEAHRLSRQVRRAQRARTNVQNASALAHRPPAAGAAAAAADPDPRALVDRLRREGPARRARRRLRPGRRDRRAHPHPRRRVVCIMLEPGIRVSHAAVALAGRAGTLLVWVGEAGVRLYAAGQPGGARADRLLWQARLALDDSPGSGSCAGCTRCASASRRPSAARSTSCAASRACACAALRADRPPARRHLAPARLRPRGLVRRGRSQPLPVGGDILPLRSRRGGDPGGGLRARDRLPAYRQAAVLRL